MDRIFFPVMVSVILITLIVGFCSRRIGGDKLVDWAFTWVE